MEGRRRLVGLVLACAVFALPASAGATSSPPTNAATDGPGALSHFDLARKDCVGTARNHRSKVWFTVADGVLSDVYFPTNDTTNNETLQYIVTDGSTFTDLQTRNMTYTVQALDDRALTCRVTATARSGRYRIVTDYFTDPDRAAVVMKTRFAALKGHRDDYKLYVRFDPTLNGNGGGGTGDNGNGGPDSGTLARRDGHTVLVGSDPVTKTNAVNRDYAVPVWSALDASRPFLAVSNDFAGADSDGLKQLDASRRLTSTFGRADNGNLVQTARVDLGHDGAFTLMLGFGQSSGEAVATAQRSEHADLSDYTREWHRYDAKLVKPRRPHSVSSHTWDQLLDQYYLSANYVKAAEDKTFRGAVAAALTSPWGQAISAGDKSNTYFGSYREVFARDLYEAWTAEFLAGDRRTAKAMTRFLFERQQLPDGSMPRNSLTNGKTAPDSFNTQLDECAYPLVMALAVGLTGHGYYEDHIKPAANFVAGHGPSFGPERWEEQGGFSPSTISAEIAGLVAAAIIADRNGDHASAQVWRGVADEFQRNLKAWTLTTNGPASAQPYFIRLSKTGDPNAAINYGLGNGQGEFDQRSIIDAGFLELARLGVLSEHDADLVHSVDVVDQTIKATTANGDGFFRYNHDGYGDRATDGRPWAPSGQGNGHLWPVLSGERGQWELDTGDLGGAIERLQAMNAMGFGVGLIPEQAWELADRAPDPFGTDPTTASIGFTNGEAAGSAAALTWSAGQFVRLMLDVSADRVLDRPFYTRNRYVRHTQGETPLTVTAPADNILVGNSVTVTGTSKPGDRIVVSAVNIDADTATAVTAVTTATGGSFSATVPVIGGTEVLNVVATDPANGNTGREVRTVVSNAPIGTLLFETTDPTLDDHGPGNYAPPTAADFHDGAWDMDQFQVFEVPGDRIAFRVRNRDQTPTFGSPLGAQLIDVYANVPAGGPTTTAASFPQRNYQVGAGWNRLLEVQGFGQKFVDPGGDVLGTINIHASAISRYITFSVPKAALGGTPGLGWRFTVVETGQDGFSPDQARGFQPLPQGFQFGVCAPTANLADPHCTFNPGLVPKAVDVLTAAGVSQADELDYTLHNPVVIQPIATP
jgi:glucoamylase